MPRRCILLDVAFDSGMEGVKWVIESGMPGGYMENRESSGYLLMSFAQKILSEHLNPHCTVLPIKRCS